MKLKLKIDGETHEVEVIQGKTILESLQDFDIPFSCLNGHCSSCQCKKISGEVEMLKNLVLTPREIENGFILTCQSYPKSDLEIDFDY